MKIKSTYVLREVADTWIVIPVGADAVDFSEMIKLNESGVMLWRALEQDCSAEDLAKVLTSEYDVTEEQARADAEAFIGRLKAAGCIEE